MTDYIDQYSGTPKETLQNLHSFYSDVVCQWIEIATPIFKKFHCKIEMNIFHFGYDDEAYAEYSFESLILEKVEDPVSGSFEFSISVGADFSKNDPKEIGFILSIIYGDRLSLYISDDDISFDWRNTLWPRSFIISLHRVIQALEKDQSVRVEGSQPCQENFPESIVLGQWWNPEQEIWQEEMWDGGVWEEVHEEEVWEEEVQEDPKTKFLFRRGC